MNAQSDSVGCSLVLGNVTLRCAFASLRNELVFVIQQESVSEKHSEERIFMYSIMIQEVSCVPNTPNTLVRCIGALVRRRDSKMQVLWMKMSGNNNLK